MEIQDEMGKKICGILRKCFEIEEEKLDKKFWKEPFTGFHFGLAGADMVYLLFEIEKEFDITITENQLAYYGFSTIEKAAKCVAESIKGGKPDTKEAAFR